MMNKTRWLILALLLSVGVNLLIVGVIGGQVMSKKKGVAPIPTHFGWLTRELDKPKMEEIRPLLAKHRKLTYPIRQEMRKAQAKFNALMIQPDIDEQAVDKSLQRLRSASDRYQTEMHRMMVHILTNLDAKQRVRISSYLKRQSRKTTRNNTQDRHHGQPVKQKSTEVRPEKTQTPPAP